MCNKSCVTVFGLSSYSEFLQSQVELNWHLKTLLMDEPCSCHPNMSSAIYSLLSVSFVPIFICLLLLFHFSLTFPFSLSICLSLSTRLRIASSSFCLPFCHLCPSQLRLLNKCISHAVELIHRSFSAAPYGPTVTLHKVFKDLVLKHILFTGGRAISSHIVCDTASSPPTSVHILCNTPQELDKKMAYHISLVPVCVFRRCVTELPFLNLGWCNTEKTWGEIVWIKGNNYGSQLYSCTQGLAKCHTNKFH